jgi:hypothetical protein
MFLRGEAIRVIVKYGRDAFHVEKGFRDVTHVRLEPQCTQNEQNMRAWESLLHD